MHASEARQRLFPLVEQVNSDHQPVRITSNAGVLMSADDYDSWQETVYLLRSPENARRLMEAVARDKAGHPHQVHEQASGDDRRPGVRSIHFNSDAWEDFLFWPASDLKTGRRIDDEHRLVYRAGDKEVKILKTRYHY